MPRRKGATLGASLKAKAKAHRARKAPERVVATPTASLTKRQVDLLAMNHNRPLRAYVGANADDQWQVYHLSGTDREWVGPVFERDAAGFAMAIRLTRALNQRGEELRIFADGTKRGNPMQQYGTFTKYRPRKAELRAMREAAEARGQDPDAAVARYAA